MILSRDYRNRHFFWLCPLPLKVLRGQFSTFLKSDLRLPLKQFLSFGNLQANSIDFPGPFRNVPATDLLSSQTPTNLCKYIQISCRHSTTDIENLAGSLVQSGDIRRSHVRNIDVVPDFAAIAINHGLYSCKHLLRKNG